MNTEFIIRKPDRNAIWTITKMKFRTFGGDSSQVNGNLEAGAVLVEPTQKGTLYAVVWKIFYGLEGTLYAAARKAFFYHDFF
jgi:uncharacterized membrane protein YccF (DUF307 family)